MNRHILIFCVGISVPFLALGCSSSNEPLQKGSAEVYREPPDVLAVSIWPKSTLIQLGEEPCVYARARVQNVTVKPLAFWVHTWLDHWVIETNDKGITGILGKGLVGSGGPAIQKLVPGDVYESGFWVSLKNNDSVKDGPLPVLISLRAGFTPMDEPVKDFTLPELKSLRAGFPPIGKKKTYWSNRVVLGIKPGKPK